MVHQSQYLYRNFLYVRGTGIIPVHKAGSRIPESQSCSGSSGFFYGRIQSPESFRMSEEKVRGESPQRRQHNRLERKMNSMNTGKESSRSRGSAYFETLCQALQQLDEVEAIALGGSRAAGQADAASDYDLYVYITSLPAQSLRQSILEPLCSRIELSNSFWELEDDCTFQDGIDIDILYRNLDDFSRSVQATVCDHQPGNAYTTCLWYNLLHSEILFDRNGNLQALQTKMNCPYPEELAEAIIHRTGRLLTGSLASYDRQLKKAVERQDQASVFHRAAAFMESCFDLLFALNHLPHPGEKRMIETLESQAQWLPDQFSERIRSFYRTLGTDPQRSLEQMNSMIESLSGLLVEHGYPPLTGCI